ncbi:MULTISPECIES: ABC transporter permease [unclassified Polaromonas]|jgi:putative ABC transport system permease protein|uniref:FtsX-like permease family protein n=1 Tax=unclassified Polaromonas TaxID=2638319 RepID=UPI000BD710B0|nr:MULTISPECIES: ABC transporter permease [unclassified Polaromonas]OYY35287.1 MAG: ABC transporter permease [Polaromonas sp. 35-63-35]OYZ19107.1 MAG: ABC transporter permease [Polaromonas sp. 16-63-31]OYZ78206.1 MAG: ABC transporter permease [Polaromonas sp. 24-63-21]OZA48764.1 MAG: ABC transporter permease [Polaromonas sp. 17-63-33]OZA87651.1 MAG: ABC transporter permease [Polaromonas sp. 39-63-25]
MLALLSTFSWQELLHHKWRNAAAVVAVMLGVALAFSVQLINASALSEFSQAVRSVNGQPDLELRAVRGGFDEAVYARVANHPQVALASPVLEFSTFAVAPGGQRVALRVVGVDALVVASLAPALMPVPSAGAERLALLAPGAVFLNAAARQSLPGDRLQLQSGLQLLDARVAGRVSAEGAALAVMDIGAAQELFGRLGQLSRIDIRLQAGADRAAFISSLQLPAGITATEPGDDAQRVSNLSRAYRVNLTVLALVALFTGAFLVFSVLSLSVAKRAQQFALLGVLGLTGRERLRLVLWESALLGTVGSVAGIALGTALAALALRVLGGDLGGGYFSGVAPALQWNAGAAAVYGLLGVAAALVGGWWPARAAQKLPPAQTLKGLGAPPAGGTPYRLSLLLMVAAGLLALTPPVFGIALGAYLSVGLLLVGGISALPWLIALLYDRIAPHVSHRLLPLLAVERARRVRGSAAVAVSGVVASLSLAVALTVMVASFRDSVTHWLDVVLPADLYVRTAGTTAASDTVFFSPAFVQALAQLPGVARLNTLRVTSLLLDPNQPAVALIARDLQDPAGSLPLVGSALPVPAGHVAIYVSEPMVDLYGARPGTVFSQLSGSFEALALDGRARGAMNSGASQANPKFYVAGVWRDYARQFGAIAMDRRDFEALTGDRRVNDIALWRAPGAGDAQLQQAVRALAQAQTGSGELIEFASSGQIRATSLRIFDRSFAVTYWLQAVAIAIGLFGVAASFSAQVLARRKEFGLLAHLGLTRRQILTLVAGEGAAWTLAGALAGLGLGLAVSLVLVHVVNPQSFHWTMDLALPWARLLALCAAVILAGTVTAWLAGRAAAGKDAVLAVKEDW